MDNPSNNTFDDITADGNCSLSAHVSSASAGAFSQQISDVMKICQTLEPIIYCFLSAIGVVGNVLVLIVSVKYRNMKTINNTIVSVLAISDLCFLFLGGPAMTIEHIMPRYPFGSAICKVSNYLMYTLMFTSIFFLCLMSMERYLAIMFPLKILSLLTKKKIRMACAFCAMTALVLCIPVLFIIDVEKSYFNRECLLKCTFSHNQIYLFTAISLQHFFICIVNIFAYALPLSVLFILYSSVFYRLLSMNAIAHTAKRHTRGAIIVLVLEVAFLLCWTPVQLILFFIHFTEVLRKVSFLTFYIVNFAVNGLAFTSSCVNPILYTFISKEYRQKLVQLLKEKRAEARSAEHRDGAADNPKEKKGLAHRKPQGQCYILQVNSPA